MTLTEALAEMADPRTLSGTFAHLLRGRVGRKNMRAILKRNAADPDTRICHSHDFIDANDVMAIAFEIVHGRPPDTGADPDIAIWNAAWAVFRRGTP